MIRLIYYLFSVKSHDFIDHGHIFRHGGASNGDSGHPGHDVHGGLGGVYNHLNGHGTHNGDSGKNGILFTDDVVHHGNGGVFVSVGNTNATLPNTMSVDDIHNKMNDVIEDAHNASIANKEAERKAELLRASIAAERAKQKQEELALLKELDDQASKEENVRPEVLGKVSIPIATFTQESFPLFHHVRDLLGKIKTIQATEAKAIQAQEMITRLDDITDQVRLQDVSLENPNAYHNFMAAGKTNGLLFHIPVVDQGGSFYISNSSTDNANATHDIPMREHSFVDGHSHFVNHGNCASGDLGAGGRTVGTQVVNALDQKIGYNPQLNSLLNNSNRGLRTEGIAPGVGNSINDTNTAVLADSSIPV
ncbi:hypothetical protein GVAV_000984 [Gurleya vavrai]